MHPFAPGDLVICIDDKPLPGRIPRVGEPWVKAGRAYRVERTSTNQAGEYGVVLVGVPNWFPSAGWHAWRFRRFEAASESFAQLITKTRVDA